MYGAAQVFNLNFFPIATVDAKTTNFGVMLGKNKIQYQFVSKPTLFPGPPLLSK